MDKPLFWLVGSLGTPPMGTEARREAGFLLRLLQQGHRLSMPDSRAMSNIGKRCHELRIEDPETDKIWRVIYRIDTDAIVILHWFAKKQQTTPKAAIQVCKSRMKDYDSD